MVNLKANPFFLDDEAVKWVEETEASMTLHEKICQLFVDPLMRMSKEELIAFLEKYPIAGSSFRALQFDNETARDIMGELQERSKIPLLYAGNCESGSNGAISGGTFVATGAQVRAARDEKIAYNVGYVLGRETSAVGFNWTFGPVGDILMNWRNSLINTRAYGEDAEFVSKCVEAYNKGCMEFGVIPCLKHFPGDGWEERDQHLAIGNNGLSVEEWDKTFGKIYKTSIDNGVLSIMVAHFTLPAYQRLFNPSLKDEDMQPACTSEELVQGLLREKLNFNGLAVTDQTMMMGYYGMRRTEALPKTIAVGCDIILGINDMEEDYAAIKAGIEQGIITEERLKDAIYRILATKAAIGLHTKKQSGKLMPDKDLLKYIGCDEHVAMAKEAAQKSITLVKNTRNQLPIRPEQYKKIGLVVLNDSLSNPKDLMGKGVASGGGKHTKDIIMDSLKEAGFETEEMVSSIRKGKTTEFNKKYDAVMIFADLSGFARCNSIRLIWPDPMSSCYPWYIHEVPVVFTSLNYTNHLIDVSRVPAFINAYNNCPDTIKEVIKRITGEAEFEGKYEENVWCDCWDTHF
jgi:beta-N-acetylhexosaminidase